LALVFPFQTLMIMMCGGAIGGGVTSALSRALGRDDAAGAQAVAWHSLLIAGFMALLYMVALGLFSRPLFALLGGIGQALDGAVLYARIAFGGAIAVWLLWVLAAVVRGTGDTVTPARAVFVSGFSQIGLSGALTLGFGPFPAIGIAGPATAMIICHGLATVYLAAYLFKGRAVVTLRAQRIHWAPIADIMRVGGLGLINSTAIAVTVITVTGFVGRYGIEALAGYGLGSRLELMLIPISFGIGGALTVAVGVNVGAGQFARARQTAWTGAGMTFAIIGAIGVAVALMPGLWLDLFTADPKAYEFGALYLTIAAPLYGFFGGGQALYFASQGTGRMTLPVLVSVVRLLVVASVGALAVYFSWQINALFVGVAAGLAVVGVGLALCMRSAAWRPERVR
jgi:putative MATE family efflux protein